MNGAQTASLLLPVLCGVGLMGLALLVARTGWQQRHNRIFAALYLLSGLNSISQGLQTPLPVAQPGDPATVADLYHQSSVFFPGGQGWLDAQIFCAVLMVPLLLLFVLNFPRPAGWVVRRPAAQGLAFLFSLGFGGVLLLRPAGIPLQPVLDAFNVLATAGTLVATYLLWRTRACTSSPIERRQSGYLLLGFMPAFAATGAITLFQYVLGPAAAGGFQAPIVYDIDPPLELAAAAVTAFAILKYRLLDFELQVKGGFRYALMSALFFALFLGLDVFVGNLFLQNGVFAFAGPAGSAALGGISTVVLFKPVHDLSDKTAQRLFPDAAGDPKEFERQRAREIYQAQATHVLRDAKVTDRELAFLRTLRDQLGLSAAAAEDIEEAVEHSLGVDSERTGHHLPPAGPSTFPPAPSAPSSVPPAPRGPAEAKPK